MRNGLRPSIVLSGEHRERRARLRAEHELTSPPVGCEWQAVRQEQLGNARIPDLAITKSKQGCGQLGGFSSRPVIELT